jgi:hypothetical protein
MPGSASTSPHLRISVRLKDHSARGNDLSTPLPPIRLSRPEARRPLVLVCAPLARSIGGGLRAPRCLAGYTRKRPRSLLARRSQAFCPGPGLTSTIAPRRVIRREPRNGHAVMIQIAKEARHLSQQREKIFIVVRRT